MKSKYLYKKHGISVFISVEPALIIKTNLLMFKVTVVQNNYYHVERYSRLTKRLEMQHTIHCKQDVVNIIRKLNLPITIYMLEKLDAHTLMKTLLR